MKAAFHAPILPLVMKEGESKKADLILMKHSHFDRTLRLRYSFRNLCFKLASSHPARRFPNSCRLRGKLTWINNFSPSECCCWIYDWRSLHIFLVQLNFCTIDWKESGKVSWFKSLLNYYCDCLLCCFCRKNTKKATDECTNYTLQHNALRWSLFLHFHVIFCKFEISQPIGF